MGKKAVKKRVQREQGRGPVVQRQVDLRKEFRSMVFFCYAMLGSLAVFPLVMELFRRFGDVAPVLKGEYPQMREIFFGMALVALFVIRFLNKSMLQKNPQENVTALVKKLRTTQIVTYALSEIPAVLGLVLFFLHGFSKEIYAFFAFSLVMMVLYFPKFEHWVVWLRK